MLENKTILITGGTGSFGKAFLNYLLENEKLLKKIIIFSRDEWKQYELKKKLFHHKEFKKIRFFIGDVRDKSRLDLAFKNVDIVIHAAALKQVDTAEYNPTEFIWTNIIGAQNVVECSHKNNVKKTIALSTDKASSPINLYGATKLCSDKLFVAANNFLGSGIFSVVRYGNVEGSRGSIMPLLLDQDKKDCDFTLTSNDMTRFSINLNRSIETVIWTIKNSIGGEIVIPKIPSYKIIDLANAINKNRKIKIIGIRPGEKKHEEMLSENESINSIETPKYFLILPFFNIINAKKYYLKKFHGKKVHENFRYSSDTNKFFLQPHQIKEIIKNLEKID
jgi:UDP-N-acetylglucosamine 4,6-dehydratase (inverting)